MKTTSIIQIFCLIGSLLGFVGLFFLFSIYEVWNRPMTVWAPVVLTVIGSLFLMYQAFKGKK